MKPELKPCPFCGGDASFDHDDNGWNWIHCKSCDATTNARVSAMDDCKPLLAEAWNHRAPAEPVNEHPDDTAVDAFAAAMKVKLAKKRAEGRSGWQACSDAYLSELLRGHVEKGDPVDVANLAMMLHQNRQSIQPAPQPQQIPEGYKLVPVEPTAQDIEGGGIVEAVTKAILFEDCGSTEDWQDNLSLGEAALQAVAAHMPVEMGAAEWAELHVLRAERGPADGVHKTWKDAAIAERCKRVLMTPRKEIIDLAKEGLGVYTGPNMNEHKICAEIVRLSAMLEAAPEPKEKP